MSPLFLTLLGLLILSGCAAQKPAVMRYSLWPQAQIQVQGQVQENPANFHLVLVWRDEFAKKRGRPAADPERFVEALSNECAKSKAGRIASYQILEDATDLDAWIGIFRPTIPVLRVNAKLGANESSGNWTISLEGESRVQALLFDTTLNATKTAVQVSRKPQPPEPSGESFSRELLRSFEIKLYKDFSAKLFEKLPKDKQDTSLYYANGKSARMKQAYAAAQSGDAKSAAKLWQDEADADPSSYKALGNLSAYYESEGNFWKAILYHAAYMEKQPKGFRSLIFQEANKERETMLKGILALKETDLSKKKMLKPEAVLAILPLENTTNDLDAPVKVRNNLAEQAQKLGYALVPMEEIDEKLKMNGFTDAGQFRAATVQKLGTMVGADYLLMGTVEEFRALPAKEVMAELKLVYAPDAQIVYDKTLRVLEEEKNVLNSILEKALAKATDLIVEKATGKILADESRMLAKRYLQAWPHFKN